MNRDTLKGSKHFCSYFVWRYSGDVMMSYHRNMYKFCLEDNKSRERSDAKARVDQSGFRL